MDESDDPKRSVLIYGPPGKGKTTLASTFPRPIQWWDFEDSSDVLDVTPGGYTDVDVKKPKKHIEVKQLMAKLPGNFNTVVVDTTTSLQDVTLAERMLQVERDSNGRRSRYEPLYQDYRVNTNMMREVFYTLQQLPIHVVFIAHDEEDRNEDGGLIAIRPDLTPKVGRSIRRLLSAVCYLDAEEKLNRPTERKLYMNQSGKIFAKNRLGIATPFVKDPTYANTFQGKKIVDE
jgi:phage nucleotide-binding protein